MAIQPDHPRMSNETSKAADQVAKLLGLAFAGADMLFEVNAAGAMSFALGAVKQVTGRDAAALTGQDWRSLVADDDCDMLSAMLRTLRPGAKLGPIALRLKPRDGRLLKRRAVLSLFRMPQRPDCISCALSLGAPGGAPAPASDSLIDRDALSASVERMLDEADGGGMPVRLELVELEGFGRSVAGMQPAEAETLRRRVAATFRAESAGGAGASELAPDRYALVRDPGSTGELSEQLQSISGGAFRPNVAALKVDAPRAQALKAMRYALDRFIERGPGDAVATFAATVDRTVQEANRFKTALAKGAFELAYQPIVDLRRRGLHHFEALVRFEPNASPADSIQLAEELGLITEFDLAVVGLVADTLATETPGIRIAANISAASLCKPGFVEALLALTADRTALRARLLLEITETQALGDLASANAAIQTLRQAGHDVCLDDFGAGAASLDYLRLLEVDFVKIDGRFVQGLDGRPRDMAVLKHVAALCRELGVVTIAEMVETPEVAGLAMSLQLDLGQGWHFGKPLAEPVWPIPTGPVRARRQGLVEQWA